MVYNQMGWKRQGNPDDYNFLTGKQPQAKNLRLFYVSCLFSKEKEAISSIHFPAESPGYYGA